VLLNDSLHATRLSTRVNNIEEYAMHSPDPAHENGWNERASQTFIAYGLYVVPEREWQL